MAKVTPITTANSSDVVGSKSPFLNSLSNPFEPETTDTFVTDQISTTGSGVEPLSKRLQNLRTGSNALPTDSLLTISPLSRLEKLKQATSTAFDTELVGNPTSFDSLASFGSNSIPDLPLLSGLTRSSIGSLPPFSNNNRGLSPFTQLPLESNKPDEIIEPEIAEVKFEIGPSEPIENQAQELSLGNNGEDIVINEQELTQSSSDGETTTSEIKTENLALPRVETTKLEGKNNKVPFAPKGFTLSTILAGIVKGKNGVTVNQGNLQGLMQQLGTENTPKN